MSTVVTLREIVLSSAKRYRSMKYSWQNRQAPFRLPSMVDACRKEKTRITISPGREVINYI